MLKDLNAMNQMFSYSKDWLLKFYDGIVCAVLRILTSRDFCHRMMSLLGFGFRALSVKTALTIISKPRSSKDLIEGKTKPFFGKRNPARMFGR